MKRMEFLKGLGLAGLSVTSLAVLTSCSKDNDKTIFGTDTDTDGTDTDASGDCSVTPSETEGPFPTHSPAHSPANYVRGNIVGDRTGIALDLDLTIRNVSDSCNVLEGSIVDIWHCDKDGNYSEYGGGGMHHVNYPLAH